MKLVAVLMSLFAAANAFTGPQLSTSKFSKTLLREADEETSAESEYKGAAAISSLTSDVKTIFTNEDIAKILPHRYPFLLVDKVVEYEVGKVRGQFLKT